MWYGTEGELRYQVMRDAAKGSPAEPFPDMAFIHWKNPYVGVTRCWGNIEYDAAADKTPGGAPHVTPFDFEYGGANDMGTYPGPAASGWVDIVPGLIPLPIPNMGIIPDAWSSVRISEKPGHFITAAETPPAFADLPTNTSSYSPALDAPSDGWVGRWASMPSGGGRVDIEIKRSSNILFHAGSTQLYDVSLDAQLHAIGSKLLLHSSRIRETQSVVEKFEGDVDIPPFDLLASAPSHHAVTQILGLQGRHKGIGGSALTGQGSPPASQSILAPPFVDCLQLNNNVTLALYVRTEPRTGFQGYSVRFLRRIDDGRLVSDLMLDSYHQIK